MNPKPGKCYSPHGYTYGIISNTPQFLSRCEAPHDVRFSNLAPSTRKSHLRMQPATWKFGFSFLAFLLAGVGGREGEVVAVSGGNVRELSSRVSRCKASCSGRWHSGGFAPHALLGPAALPVWMAVVTDEILWVDSMFVSPPSIKKNVVGL